MKYILLILIKVNCVLSCPATKTIAKPPPTSKTTENIPEGQIGTEENRELTQHTTVTRVPIKVTETPSKTDGTTIINLIPKEPLGIDTITKDRNTSTTSTTPQ